MQLASRISFLVFQLFLFFTLLPADPPKNVTASISPSSEMVEFSSVTLTCSCDANPPVKSYQWFKGTVLRSSGKNLVITNISSEDTGTYKCKVINNHGQQYSNGVFLNVLYPPRNVSVSISPPGEKVEGSLVNLTCSSDANPPVQNYTWFKEGAASPAGFERSYIITEKDRGWYYCEAWNKIGGKKALAVLVPNHVSSSAHSYTFIILGATSCIGTLVICFVFAWRVRQAKSQREVVLPASPTPALEKCGAKDSLPLALVDFNTVSNTYVTADDSCLPLDDEATVFDSSYIEFDATCAHPSDTQHTLAQVYGNIDTCSADGTYTVNDDAEAVYENVGREKSNFELDQ